MPSTIERIPYLDYLRAIAILGIIAIHSFGEFHPVVYALRFSVPLYVMLSGTLLLARPKESYSSFLKHRLVRLGIPLIVWSVLFAIFGKVTDMHFSWYDYFFRVIFFGQPFYLLFVLLNLYIVTPWLQTWIQGSSKNDQYAVVGYALGLAAAAATLENWLLAGSNILPHFSFTYFIYFLGYYVAGYTLSTQSVSISAAKLILGYGLSVMIVAVSAMLLLARYGAVPKAYVGYDYLSFPVMLMSLCVFLILKKLSLKPYTLITALSNASFGMYFIHMLILPVLPVTYAAPLKWMIASVASFLCTVAMSHIPKVNQSLGCNV